MSKFDIGVVGEINLDLILYGLPEQMAIERELIGNAFIATLGSASAIVAHNAAALGAKVCFATAVGSDDFGRLALERLKDIGVDLSGVRRLAGRQTGVTILLVHGETRHILTYPGTMEVLRVEDLDFEQISDARHFHLSSLYLQKGLHPGLPSLLQRMKKTGLTISLDTNDDPENAWDWPLQELLPYVDCFLPSESEICRMTGCARLEDALDALSQEIPVVVVKRGSRGVRVREGRRRFNVEPISVVPVDTIGAGDSFDAGFLVAYLAGRDIGTCAAAGNIAGALSTQGQGGTESFRNHEVREAFLSKHHFFELVKG